MKLIVKNIFLAAGLILTFFSSEGLALSSKEKSFTMIASCAVGGGLIGDQLGQAANKKNYNQSATIATSALFTGLLCMAYDLIFEPFPSKEHELEKEIVALRAMHEKMGLSLTKEAYGTDKPKGFDLYDHMELQESLIGDEKFNEMVSSDCSYKGLELGGKSLRGREIYIPVSKNIIMKGFEYYVVYPKNRAVRNKPCVTPLAGSDYLNKKLPGFGEALYIEGSKQINKKLKQKRKAK